MPPCIWMASAHTLSKASGQANEARVTARSASDPGDDAFHCDAKLLAGDIVQVTGRGCAKLPIFGKHKLRF